MAVVMALKVLKKTKMKKKKAKKICLQQDRRRDSDCVHDARRDLE